MNKQAVVDVLNSLKVIESQGGEDAYVLVENSESNRSKLIAVGVSEEKIYAYGDKETFCILSLAFGEEYANEYIDGKFYLQAVFDEDACAEHIFNTLIERGVAVRIEDIRLIMSLEYEYGVSIGIYPPLDSEE